MENGPQTVRSKAWITGAGGLLGSHLVNLGAQSAPDCTIVGLTRGQLDLLDFAGVCTTFRHQNPQLVIHCAALSRTQECQANPALARKLNVDLTALLAELAADIHLIFFSTDLVFDGKRGAYDECAAVNPLSIYAETKVAAEQIVLANPRHTVIRTSLNGGTSPTGDRGFNEQMRQAWQAGVTLRLFTDEFRSPIPAVETARAVWELVLKNKPGLYHIAGSETLSRWQIGQLLAARWPQLKPQIEPASVNGSPPPPRPPNTSLNCSKAQALLSFPLPRFSDWLAAHPKTEF